MMEILQDVNFYKLVISIFVPLAIFVTLFWFLNKKNK
jgi:hypothetical protein